MTGGVDDPQPDRHTGKIAIRSEFLGSLSALSSLAASANVRQSQQYEQVLNSNSSFRAKRMQQECGPITDPELHASCVASFAGDGTPPTRKSRQQ